MEIRIAKTGDIKNILKFEHIPADRLNFCIKNGFEYVIIVNDRIRGVMRYNLFWQAIPFLDLIYLESDIRNKGIGTVCMQFWEAEMKRKGYAYVMISTQEDETAKYFYEKIGYTRIGSFLPPGQNANGLMYIKRI